MKNKTIERFSVLLALLFLATAFSGCVGEDSGGAGEYKAVETSNEEVFPELDPNEVTTTWDSSHLVESQEAALEEFEIIKAQSEDVNKIFRPAFETLNGTVLLEYLETEKEFSKALEILYIYAYVENSLDVNDVFFETLLMDLQDLAMEHGKSIAFVEVKLTSLTEPEWEQIFTEEPGLDSYHPYLEANYIRFAEHSSRNEEEAAYLAELSNERMKLQTVALKEITNNVTAAGNITLENGEEFTVNSQSYYALMSTDPNRENRKACYDKYFYHLLNESDKMAALYSEKAELDDRAARELNYADYYEARLFGLYLKETQVEDMNSVFKARKGVFEGYNDFRRQKMGLETLKPYDMSLQLMENPGQGTNYTDTLLKIQKSYSKMDPRFNEVFLKTVTGNYIDVYPAPESGKQPGGYCFPLVALQSPSMIFMNYRGLLNDQKTISHEMGHAIHFYLMGNTVDYLYCNPSEYEAEIASTFSEELFVDYVLANSDRDTAEAVLTQHVGDYQKYFSYAPLISEFERDAHILCAENGQVNGEELNALWTNLSKEYVSDSIEYYPENSAAWTPVLHIYLSNNYYAFNYAVSEAITLALFKQYREDPEVFNENYIEYLSAGTTMPPEAKLEKYFGIRIDKQLFEDAMDVAELRIKELNELSEAENGLSPGLFKSEVYIGS